MTAAPAKTELVAEALAIIANGPAGASVIHERLLGRGFQLSEPTVSRLLRSFDRRGLTTSQGRRGRVITAKGRTEVRRLQEGTRRAHTTRRLFERLEGDDLSAVLDVLVVRRGIEREIAREATRRASAKDIEALKEHDGKIARGETEVPVHDLLAQATHNTVLESVYHLIRRDPEDHMMRRIWSESGMTFDTALHRGLIAAVIKKDVAKAEALAVRHMDQNIEMVRAFQASNDRRDRQNGRSARAVPARSSKR